MKIKNAVTKIKNLSFAYDFFANKTGIYFIN